MSMIENAAELASHPDRSAGSDAERRAAGELARRLERSGRIVTIEPFWCRPNWALANAWHAGLGVVGSLLCVDSPRPGAAIVLLALLSVIANAQLGRSPGRWLTPERASQNVVASRPDPTRTKRVKLIVTAGYDAGRAGLVYRTALRRISAGASRATGGLLPGWIGWLSLALAAVLLTAILRLEGDHGVAVGVLQLLPTIVLVLALAALLELGGAMVSPGGNGPDSAVAVALAMVNALDAAPPGHAVVELVLTGASDGANLGLREYLRTHRRSLEAASTVVIGIGPCGAGTPRYWHSDGPLVPMRYFKVLRTLCAQLAAADPGLGLAGHRGRGSSPALPARLARLPAISIGALTADGLVPHTYQLGDTAAALDEQAMGRTLEFGLLLTDAIDGYLARMPRPVTPAPLTPTSVPPTPTAV
ncbi:MAG: hypothetical protein ACYC91_15125 [Solirubrobacteraceae bacterium]